MNPHLDDQAQSRRDEMVESQIRARGISSACVLSALRATPRERFVPPALGSRAYDDAALPAEQRGHALPTILASAVIVGANEKHTLGIRRVRVDANHRNSLQDGMINRIFERFGIADGNHDARRMLGNGLLERGKFLLGRKTRRSFHVNLDARLLPDVG